MTAPRIYWIGSPMFTAGHPAPLIALVHHRMVGSLRSTDAAFTSSDGRQASTNFGVGYNCGVAGHPTGQAGAHVHQYVRLGDQAWGNGNWDPTGAWDNRYPTTYVNSRTISIEHHDNGGRKRGTGKGVVPEAVLAVSIELDRLLLRGDVSELRDAGIRFRSGFEAAIARELRAIPVDRNHLVDHHYIAGRLKPYCWRPWADDPTGFPQARYIASLSAAPEPVEEPVKSFPVPEARTLAKIADRAWLYVDSSLAPNTGNVQVSPSRELVLVGEYAAGVRIVAYEPAAGDADTVGRAMFVRSADVLSTRLAPDSTPYSAADMTKAENLGWNAARTAAIAAAQGVPTK